MTHANFPTLVPTSHFAAPPTATLPPPPSSASAMALASTASSSSSAPRAAALPVLYEGKTQFENVAGDAFHFVVSSDKIETVVVLESRKFKQKWECRLDDAAVKRCGPRDVEVPRHAVVAMLGAALDGSDSTHQVKLERNDSGGVVLTLLLRFSPMFTPSYAFEMTHIQLSKEDVLQAQVLDLQEEVSTLRRELSELRELFSRFHAGNGEESAAFSCPSTPQPNAFKSSTVDSNNNNTNASTRSNLNARAAEFVFGRPAPTNQDNTKTCIPSQPPNTSQPTSKFEALLQRPAPNHSGAPAPYTFADAQQSTSPFQYYAA
ncbi:hypothetical protein PINS_up007622 [Pythium insidiosum]|nr:hypothetical protein PINS_up007622 [Pythium insidiosum]